MPRENSLCLVDTATLQSLVLRSVDLDITILTFLVEVEILLKFENITNDMINEAELSFPLQQAASVCGYSVDIDGSLVDAVVVSKEKARKTFEEETKTFHKHKTSIVEQHGNVFKTKINCTRPHQIRTLKLKISQSLQDTVSLSSKIMQSIFRFPLFTEDSCEVSISARARVFEGNISSFNNDPELFDSTIGDIRSNWWPEFLFLDSTGKNFTPHKGEYRLSLYYPELKFNGGFTIKTFHFSTPVTLLGSDVPSKPEDHFVFFARDFITDINNISDKKTKSKFSRQSINILWDASLSRGFSNENLNREKDINFVEQLAGKWKNSSITISIFNYDIQASKEFNSQQIYQIKNFLKNIRYDGGTRYQSLKFTKNYDFYILFTDGFNTLGPKNYIPTIIEAPIYICCSSLKRYEPFMKRLTKRSGGKYISCTRDSFQYSQQDIDSIGNINNDFRFLYAIYDHNVFSDVFPCHPSTVQGTYMDISGKINKRNFDGDIKISLNYGREKVEKTTILNIPVSLLSNNIYQNSQFSGMIQRFWVQKNVDHVMVEEDLEEKKSEIIQNLGKKYHVVTEYTSLIVLENLSQYLLHKITPPPSLPKILEEYNILMEKSNQESENKLKEKMDYVQDIWQRKLKWWQNDYKVKPNQSQVLHFLSLNGEQNNNFNEEYLNGSLTEYNSLKYSLKRQPEGSIQKSKRKRRVFRSTLEGEYDYKRNDDMNIDPSYCESLDDLTESDELPSSSIKKPHRFRPGSAAQREIRRRLLKDKKFKSEKTTRKRDVFYDLPKNMSKYKNFVEPTSPSNYRSFKKIDDMPQILRDIAINSRQFDISPNLRLPKKPSTQDWDDIDLDKKKKKKRYDVHQSLLDIECEVDKEFEIDIDQLNDELEDDELENDELEDDELESDELEDDKLENDELEDDKLESDELDDDDLETFLVDEIFEEIPINIKSLEKQYGESNNNNITTLRSSKNKYLTYLSFNPPVGFETHHWTFYLDIALFFLYECYDFPSFLKILTNIIELKEDEVIHYRTLSNILSSDKICNLAGSRIDIYSILLDIYEKIFEMRPEEPSSLRDLACALTEYFPKKEYKTNNMELPYSILKRLSILYKRIIETKWDKRFKSSQIEVIAIEELCQTIQTCQYLHFQNPTLNFDKFENEIRHLMMNDNPYFEPLLKQSIDADLRVIITWDEPQSDIDLHVIEPDGQLCYSMNNITSNGGIRSCDCITGGPEEYMIRNAKPGKYNIIVKLFSRINKNIPVTVKCTIISFFGNKQKQKSKTNFVVLRDDKQSFEIGEVLFQ